MWKAVISCNVVLQKLLLSIARFPLRGIDCNGRYILANVLRREECHRSQGWMACVIHSGSGLLVSLSLGTDALINCSFCEVVNSWEPMPENLYF